MSLPTRAVSNHSFIHYISIAPLQVLYYSEALPTQHGYGVGVSRRSATDNITASEGLAQGPYVAARTGYIRIRGVVQNVAYSKSRSGCQRISEGCWIGYRLPQKFSDTFN